MDRVAAAISTLDSWSVEVCVVDNRRLYGPPETGRYGPVIAGDNRVHEFSGFEAGRQFVTANGGRPDLWLFVNDRFDAYHDPLRPLSAGALDLVREVSGLAGHLDAYPRPAYFDGVEVTSWIATSFFVISSAALDRLGSLVSIDDEALQRVLLPAYVEGRIPFRSDGPVTGQYLAYLLEWLTQSGTSGELADTWYKRLRLGPETWDTFRAKVRSILNEQLLSARCRALGVPVIPLDVADHLAAMPEDWPSVQAAVERLRQPSQSPPRIAGPGPRLALAVRALGDNRRVRRSRLGGD